MFSKVRILAIRPAWRPQQRSWPEWALTYLFALRAVVVAGCLLAVAVAWLAHIPWLLMAGTCIAVGEFLECTYYISVLKWAEHTGRLRSAPLVRAQAR